MDNHPHSALLSMSTTRQSRHHPEPPTHLVVNSVDCSTCGEILSKCFHVPPLLARNQKEDKERNVNEDEIYTKFPTASLPVSCASIYVILEEWCQQPPSHYHQQLLAMSICRQLLHCNNLIKGHKDIVSLLSVLLSLSAIFKGHSRDKTLKRHSTDFLRQFPSTTNDKEMEQSAGLLHCLSSRQHLGR